jgi:hypothetical protein
LTNIIFNPRYLYIVLLLLSICYLSIFIFQIEDDSELGYIDHDLVYQVERFALYADSSHQIYGTAIYDYGLELYYLSPILKVLNYIFPTVDRNLLSYKVLTWFHILLSSMGIVFLCKMLYKEKVDIFLVIIFFLSILSSSLYVFNSTFIKPDPNTVFFLIVLSLYLFHFKKFKNVWWKIIFVIFLVILGFLVKWWTIFLMPVYYLSSKLNNFKSNNRRYFEFVMFSISLIIFSITAKFVRDYSNYFIYCSLTSFLMFFSILLYLDKIKILKVTLFYLRWSVMGFLNIGFLLVSSDFYRTSVDFYRQAIHRPSLNSPGFVPFIIPNFKAWFSDSLESGFFTLPIFLMVLLGILSAFLLGRETRESKIQKNTFFFFSLIMLFLFLFVSKVNQPTQAMLYPILLFIIFLFFRGKKNDKRILYSSYFLGCCIIVSNLYPVKTGNGEYNQGLINYIKNVNNIHINVQNFRHKVAPFLESNKKVYVSDFLIPLSKKDTHWIFLNWGGNLKELNKVKIGEYVFASHVSKNYLEQSGNFLKIKEVNLIHPMRSNGNQIEIIGIYERAK